MVEFVPKINPEGIYSAKRACVELGVTYYTLRSFRKKGFIEPINPKNRFRSRYTGQAIINCWYEAIKS